jgi:sugar/nucleoside kinase (ribokinase family)
MVIHGTGCCLMDFLYAQVDFSGPSFKAAMSLKEGDGGLTPGRLVFAEDLERFTGRNYEHMLADLCGGTVPASSNLGGPSVVSLAHAAQMLQGTGHSVCFYGARGTDETGTLIEQALAKLPFTGGGLLLKEGPTARTDVLSDPHYDNGQGERTFIHLPGAASLLYPEDLESSFFDAHLVAFGGTALLPHIHDGLTELLKKARKNDAVTVANLVYDYRSETHIPQMKWRLGMEDDAYPYIDILIADRDEALKTSGCDSAEAAAGWFLARGTGAVIITQGVKPLVLAAGKGVFAPLELTYLPVCEKINRELREGIHHGDTTGCGDNFTGGIIVAMTEQLPCRSGGKADLREACIPAIAAGGFACFTLGGVFYENRPGEKRERIASYSEAYRKQLERQ